jgi:hypothetical protein
MTKMRKFRVVMILGVVVALTVLLLVSGCGSKSSGTTTGKTGSTALGSLPVARSALSTMAPDAKLLVVQMAQGATPTETPVWAYLFGSPSSDKIFAVYTTGGKVMQAQESGTGGLTADQWKDVPGTEDWKVDSDEAYKKAVAVSGASGDPAGYFMGMLIYKSPEDTSTVKPFVWQVFLDAGTSGATTSTIEVDAKTGSAAVAK